MWRILDFDSACFCAGKRIRRAKVMENTQDYQDYQDYRAEILGIVRSNASPGSPSMISEVPISKNGAKFPREL